jgi:hypothetical protein
MPKLYRTYEVRACDGSIFLSTTDIQAAIAAARAESAGLLDSDAGCSDDGWPTIIASDGSRVDY